MFTNNDIEFQELVRTEPILPYLTNDFLQLYAEEIAGGLLFDAFLKANDKLRPIVCGDTLRRCLAFLVAQFLKSDADSSPNFIQCAEGLRDGATECAQLLKTLVSAPANHNPERALLNIDLRNAFNEANRHAAFDALTGKASRAYDNERACKLATSVDHD